MAAECWHVAIGNAGVSQSGMQRVAIGNATCRFGNAGMSQTAACVPRRKKTGVSCAKFYFCLPLQQSRGEIRFTDALAFYFALAGKTSEIFFGIAADDEAEAAPRNGPPCHKDWLCTRFGVEAFLSCDRGSNSDVCPSGKRIRMNHAIFVPHACTP